MRPGLRRRRDLRAVTALITSSRAPVLHPQPVDVAVARLAAHCPCCVLRFKPAPCPVVHDQPCSFPVCGRTPAAASA